MSTTPKASPADIMPLAQVMARLRDPETGCPWDIEQDFVSIAPYTIEEAYEVADAIAHNDMAALRDELGDLLFVATNLARKLGIDPGSLAPWRHLFDCSCRLNRWLLGRRLLWLSSGSRSRDGLYLWLGHDGFVRHVPAAQ